MKTLLVKPNEKNRQYQGTEKLSAIEFPLWMSIFANYYKATKLIDAEAENLNIYDTIEEIKKYNPDEVIIFCTGSHPSANIQQEEIAKEMCQVLQRKKIKTSYINKLPMSPISLGKPRYDLLDIKKYRAHNWHSWSNNCISQPYGTVYTSISCPFSCNFCQVKSFYGNKYEARTVEAIIEDFRDLGEMGVTNIKIMDELFIFDNNRVKLICKKIKELNYNFNIWAYARIDIMDEDILKSLKSAGINWLAYGIETGNESIRKNVLKGNFNNIRIQKVIQITKDAGINVLGNFMFGFWEDTLKTMEETLNFALHLNCEYANLYCVVAYPESELYNDMKKKKIELPKYGAEYAQMSSYFKPLPTKFLTREEVLTFRDKAFDIYHNNGRYQNMMKEKFGIRILQDINKMNTIKIKREILNR